MYAGSKQYATWNEKSFNETARLLIMFPKVSFGRESVENHSTTAGIPDKYVSIRKDMESFEFAQGL